MRVGLRSDELVSGLGHDAMSAPGNVVHSVAGPVTGSVYGENFVVVQESVKDCGGEDVVAEEGSILPTASQALPGQM